MAKKIRGRNEGSIWSEGDRIRAAVSDKGIRKTTTVETKQEGYDWIRKMKNNLDQGYDIEGSKILLGDYLDKWIDSHSSSIQETTAYHYKSVIKNHIKPYLGCISLCDLRLEVIERLYSQLIKSGLGIRTVRVVHSVLHVAFEKALKYGLVIKNPAHGASLPKYRHSEMVVLDETQINHFLVIARESESDKEALYHIAVTTGMRQGEIFGLKWSDLQWHSGILSVQRQVKRPTGQGWIFAPPKTKSGVRTIQLGEGVLHVLRRHKVNQDTLISVHADKWQKNNLLFTNSIGNPLDGSNLRKDFYRILDTAGLPKIRFHDLRHTAASLMLNNGIDLIVVSKILGHSKPSVTMDIYGHLLPGKQFEAAKLMDDLIQPIQFQANNLNVFTKTGFGEK